MATIQEIRKEKEIEARVYTFWYSEQHARHYARINQENPIDYDGKPDPVHKNFAEIDGQLIPYTTCTTQPEATEPFDGAMERFPDYKKVAEGKIRNIRTRGIW